MVIFKIKVIYQTVFNRISKHRQESLKAEFFFFATMRNVEKFDRFKNFYKCVQTLPWVLDYIFSIKIKTNEKMEK